MTLEDNNMTPEGFWRKYSGTDFLIEHVKNPGIKDTVCIKEHSNSSNTLTIISNGVKIREQSFIDIFGTDPEITISVDDIAWHDRTDLNKIE